MSHRLQIGLLALLTLRVPAPLAAQQDQMQHGEMQHDEMKKDAMAKDAMGKDAMAMDHGAMMLPHGTFAAAGGHKAGGSFALSTAGGKTQLKLGDDFSVEKTPDLYVVLSTGPSVTEGAVFLGKLSKFSGAQVFDVPAGTNLQGFSHLVLWSKKDKVALGAASLADGGGMMHK
jgi:pentapeptide MXKDX repeat protein